MPVPISSSEPGSGTGRLTAVRVRKLKIGSRLPRALTKVGVTSVHPGGIRTNIARNQRLLDEAEREQQAQDFDRLARMSPERAARRIVRAIEKNKQRLRITTETYLTDWLKRLFPSATQRLVAHLYQRSGGIP